MEERKPLLTWVKEHKTELIILGVTAVGTILIIKNWDSIKGVFKSSNSISTPVVKIQPVVEKVVVPVISSEILANLTGNKLTAIMYKMVGVLDIIIYTKNLSDRIIEIGLNSIKPSSLILASSLDKDVL